MDYLKARGQLTSPLEAGSESEGGGEVWCLDVRAQSQREAGSEMQKQEEVLWSRAVAVESLVKFDHHRTLSERVGGDFSDI